MKNNRKGQSAWRDTLPYKDKNEGVKKFSVKNYTGEYEYEEDRTMRSKPQSFKSFRRNTMHDDNKDE